MHTFARDSNLNLFRLVSSPFQVEYAAIALDGPDGGRVRYRRTLSVEAGSRAFRERKVRSMEDENLVAVVTFSSTSTGITLIPYRQGGKSSKSCLRYKTTPLIQNDIL